MAVKYECDVCLNLNKTQGGSARVDEGLSGARYNDTLEWNHLCSTCISKIKTFIYGLQREAKNSVRSG